MMKSTPARILVIILLLVFSGQYLLPQQQPAPAGSMNRFPKPEFESGYVQPNPTTPEPRTVALEYFDVFVLLAVLSLRKSATRSRGRPQNPFNSWIATFYCFSYNSWINGRLIPWHPT